MATGEVVAGEVHLSRVASGDGEIEISERRSAWLGGVIDGCTSAALGLLTIGAETALAIDLLGNHMTNEGISSSLRRAGLMGTSGCTSVPRLLLLPTGGREGCKYACRAAATEESFGAEPVRS